MPVEYFIRYKGKFYDVGTKLRFKTSIASWADVKEGTIENISGVEIYIRLTDGRIWYLSQHDPLEKLIIEIIEPIYYVEKTQECMSDNRVRPSIESIFIGTVWYIVIMLIGLIFKDKWLIWIVATTIFLLWKNGFMNKNNNN